MRGYILPTADFKGRTFVSSWLSTEGDLKFCVRSLPLRKGTSLWFSVCVCVCCVEGCVERTSVLPLRHKILFLPSKDTRVQNI